MPDFTINESDQGEYSIYWIQCFEEFNTIKKAKDYLKSLGIKPKQYEVRRA